MGISGIPLGISGREDSVDQNKGANDLSTQSSTRAVPISQGISPTTIPVVVRLLEGLDQPNSTDSSQALSHHVHDSSDQRHLAGQKQPKCYRWVNVTPCKTTSTKPSSIRAQTYMVILNKQLLEKKIATRAKKEKKKY